jgi:uncharacterized protein YbbC (DUF1343 family)
LILLAQKISILKIFAPEHGFRGTADAGEHIVDGMDSTTDYRLFLYGSNKKPTLGQLKGIDIMVLIYKMWELDFTLTSPHYII